jgi:aminomethyltransferase
VGSFTSNETSAATPDAVAAEYRALRERAGFRRLDDRALIRVLGDDRAEFFHGITSNNLKAAKSGDVVPALFLTEHAHVIGGVFVWVDDSTLYLETDRRAWPGEQEHIERLLVADDVEMQELPNRTILHIEGPQSAEVLESAGMGSVGGLGNWKSTKSGELKIARIPRFGSDGFSIMGDSSALASLADRLTQHGASAVSEEALEIIRVENGLARIGVDTAEKTIALEARLNRAISLNKGCYLGQETVERATSRGGIRKKLMGLRFERPAAAGAVLMIDGKEVGRLTSSVVSPRLGPIGLSIVRDTAWSPGTALSLRGGDIESTAIVSEIPFDENSPN